MRMALSFVIKIMIIFFVSLFVLIQPVGAVASQRKSVPDFFSEAVVIIDSNTGQVLFQKNGGKQMYPASITKIITAIIALETNDPDELVTVSNKAVHAEGTRVYLLEGEEMALGQLLQGLMISSGNDAAIAIAEHVDGSVEAFADRMNRFAEEKAGTTRSSFSNPHGLFEEEHITTAADMAKISAYAMKNEAFRELVSTEYIDWTGEGWETRLYNHHPLLRSEEEVIGIKNGFVTMAGYTLSTAVERDGTEIIIVSLKAPSKEHARLDALAAAEYALSGYETRYISFENEPYLRDYIFPESISVTVRKGEEVSWNVSSDRGIVSVYGEDDREIMKVDLEERKMVELPWFSIDGPFTEMEKEEESRLRILLDWFIITGFPLVFTNEITQP